MRYANKTTVNYGQCDNISSQCCLPPPLPFDVHQSAMIYLIVYLRRNNKHQTGLLIAFKVILRAFISFQFRMIHH